MKLGILAVGLTLAACGGTQSKGSGGGGGGGGGDGADGGTASAWGGGGADGGAAGGEGGPASAPAGPPPVVTFVLENKGKSDLIFAIDKGWGQQLTAFTGKPPKAKAAILFSKACTESCEAAPETMCPDCAEEQEDMKKRHQEERDETKREVAPVGGSVEVPWDGKIFAYEKAPKGVGPKKKCECWRKVDPEAGTYTIRACGLRPAAKTGEASKSACVDTKVDLPPEEPGRRVTITFTK